MSQEPLMAKVFVTSSRHSFHFSPIKFYLNLIVYFGCGRKQRVDNNSLRCYNILLMSISLTSLLHFLSYSSHSNSIIPVQPPKHV